MRTPPSKHQVACEGASCKAAGGAAIVDLCFALEPRSPSAGRRSTEGEGERKPPTCRPAASTCQRTRQSASATIFQSSTILVFPSVALPAFSCANGTFTSAFCAAGAFAKSISSTQAANGRNDPPRSTLPAKLRPATPPPIKTTPSSTHGRRCRGDPEEEKHLYRLHCSPWWGFDDSSTTDCVKRSWTRRSLGSIPVIGWIIN